ncbi:MobH family relaxase [Kushneria indalinina]|uniref:Integrating conjugative element relaxase (TIGR03760 family) n=1 Tax=Kushneria indalinina DSM 14324 TaxID=1122140 RepID=A0A3D9DRP8_9GAMM|nr:MobH family relaxase [Kushneria indalinina]REC93397.1 integrating conjugative element relaxase (TIGR03760 family) [Kushneria indalinina DSM 14324]
MLRRLFTRSAPASRGKEGFHSPVTGKELLAKPRRQQMIKTLWDTTSLTQDVFNEYLLGPIHRYAELVQLLPASESHHHAYAGGMLDHALEMSCYGLRLRQRHLLPPGARPEDQSSAGELWSAAVIYGSLMHDVAKTLVDVEIHLDDGREWRLWHGVIPGPYRVRYRAGREYHLHSAVNPLLAQQVLGPKILDWLMTQPKLFSVLMYTISGHTERGGIIAELIHQADRASVAKALGGNPVQALSAPVESIQRKLAEGLRYLVREQFKLNQKGGMGWLTDEALWLMSPKAVNELKAHLYAQGIKSIPADLNRLYGELQAHGLIEEVSDGKSVWKCDITDGEWKQTFNMIRVPPTLIWGVEGKPATFSGTVTVQGAGAAEEEKATDAPSAPQNNSPAEQKAPKPTSETTSTSTSHPQPEKAPSDPAPSDDGIDDDILALFPEGNSGSEKTQEPEMIEGRSTAGEPATQATQATQATSSTPQKKETSTTVQTSEYKNSSDLGVRFWQWLKDGLANHTIIFNDTNAPVHVVAGTYFLVSPGIFKRFSREMLNKESEWQAVQKRFQKLGVHARYKGENFHRVTVQGMNKNGLLKGYLIKDPHELSQKIPSDNWVLALHSSDSE